MKDSAVILDTATMYAIVHNAFVESLDDQGRFSAQGSGTQAERFDLLIGIEEVTDSTLAALAWLARHRRGPKAKIAAIVEKSAYKLVPNFAGFLVADAKSYPSIVGLVMLLEGARSWASPQIAAIDDP